MCWPQMAVEESAIQEKKLSGKAPRVSKLLSQSSQPKVNISVMNYTTVFCIYFLLWIEIDGNRTLSSFCHKLQSPQVLSGTVV